MHVTVREVSKLLNVSESTVSRWIKQRGLPVHDIGGKYHFHRAELLEWATANQIQVSVELFDHLENEDEPVPKVAEALEAGGIFYHLPAKTQEQALRALVQVLPIPGGIDRELLLRLFLARESSASTGVGDGIALPHVRNPIVLHVDRPLLTLCFLEQPVEFGALDGQPVHVLFSLICPTMRNHLQLLSRLSFALHDAKFKDVVTRHATREEIIQEARRIETALDAPTKEITS